MSLRSYLFSLVGGLIVLLTLTQLFLVYWIEQTLTEEVNHKAKVLSQQMIALVFDEIEQEDVMEGNHKIIKSSVNSESERIKVRIIPDNKVPNKTVSNKELTIVNEEVSSFIQLNKDTNNQKQPIKLAKVKPFAQTKNTANQHAKEDQKQRAQTKPINVNKEIITKELKNLFEQRVHRINTTDNATFVIKSPNGQNKVWLEHEAKIESSNTKQLINNVQMGIIISAVIALIFAYWLSIQFNKPLKNLIGGFKSLANGDYNQNVKENGVNEIKTTIKHFNNMRQKLEKLTKAEKQHKEIAHLAELGEVSRGLAHALRNPIHTIGLSIEQLSDEQLSNNQRDKLITTVQNKITHIDKNIKALLTLTTTGINRDQQVPILTVIQDVILEYKSCQPKPQNFVINVDANITLLGAESEIRSILHTLIINACEANPVNGQVTITLNQPDNRYIEINIADEGQGIDKKIATELFKPHISTKPEGAGMGLYIAKRIITLHYHGELTLSNQVQDQQCTGCLAQARFYIGP